MRPPNIRFVSNFVSDIIDMGTYSRGKVPLSKVTTRNDSLVVRVEDCLLDMFVEPFKAQVSEQAAKEQIMYSKVNSLMRLQGKTASELQKILGLEINEKSFLESAVFYPLFSFLSDLSTINYPVTLLHDTPEMVETHPVCSLLGFPVISLNKMYFYKDSVFISPYASEGPDYLFPRSFNKDDMDDIFTLIV